MILDFFSASSSFTPNRSSNSVGEDKRPSLSGYVPIIS